jgi:hypothetical protein
MPEDPTPPAAPPASDAIGAVLTEAASGATLVQEIVDFLHKLFPGHGAPGVPSPTA